MTMQTISRRAGTAMILGLTLAVGTTLSARDEGSHVERQQARQILEAAGIKGGLVVHLGCGDGKLTAALRADDSYLIHGLDADARNVERAREHVRSLGLYGKVSIDRQSGNRLPYTDNLVNLVVAENPGEIAMDEIMRVLCPNGVAYVKTGDTWTRSIKPRPESIDEWTHTLHAADGNAVAHDSMVGPPHHIQWVGQPRSARQHERLGSVSAVVSSGGRVFSIQDEGPVASILLPPRWFLVARDAYSGVILWKRPVGPWEGHLRSFRMGPSQLARRLVAVGDRVYVTLGYGKPVCRLDAATGETVKTYQGTDRTTEIVHQGGVLYLVAGDFDAEAATQAAKRRGTSPPVRNDRLLVIQADTGDLLWEKSDADTAGLMPTTLAVSGDRLVFQNPGEVLCLDAKSGRELWRTARPVSSTRPGFSAPTLVIYNDVVLSADRAAPGEVEKEPERIHKTSWVDAPTGALIALSAKTGRELWRYKCRECFNAPVDVLVADGLVWSGELVVAGDPGITVGRDPVTGEIKRRRPADQAFFQVGMPHHRCYRNRATDRYLVLGRAGVEFIDVVSGRAIPNHWIRGTCQHGILPANGLLYVPPHSCACYIQAKLNGFNALAPKRESNPAADQAGNNKRLERGPAYGEAVGHQSSIIDHQSTDWPTYRHDASRSGCTQAAVPAELKSTWETKPGARLTSLVIAEGKVFVASIDDHAVHALDADDGRPLWRYTAGGRVDSPPTIYKGLALFGSADGSVYCLRASDGQLAWRFQAAPEDRRVVAYGQLESTWPVHGNVLVEDGVAYFAAGRSSYLDGGIYLYRLDPKSGKLLSRTCINSRDPNTGYQRKGAVEMFDLPGALPDVLSSDGTSIFMRHMRFDRQGVEQAEGAPHLFSPTGLLDDLWWHRSYWIFGSRFYTGYRDWFRAGREVPGGRILVFDESSVYGFGRKPEYFYWSTPLEYHLFAAGKEPEIVESPKKTPRVPAWGQREIQYDWSEEVPFQVRAMVLADETLFIAGPPDVLDEEEALRNPDDATIRAKLAEQVDALAGRKGGVLWAVSASEGKRLAEYPLAAPPTWDAMAATQGRLYLATTDGTVLCLAGQ